MAVTATTITRTSTGRGRKFDGYSSEIIGVTKLTGDTTATITSTVLKRINSVLVKALDNTTVSATATITNSDNLASVAFTGLGAGTALVVEFVGSKR